MTHPSTPCASSSVDGGSAVVRLGFTAEPIVDISGASETPLYSECLARMMVADSAVLKGGDFIEDLETYGGIELLDAAILDLVLDALADDPGVALGCNISPRTLSDATAWKSVLRRVDERQWLASRLTLEMTETCPLNEIPHAGSRLAELRRLGCRIAIDDFGAGYASTQYLQQADIEWDVVKIDRSCFAGPHDGPSVRNTLHSLVLQASCFAPVVVVEGLETYDRLSAAQDAGARFGQGWLFDGPVRDRWMTPGAASRLSAAMMRSCATAKQLSRSNPRSGQGVHPCAKHSQAAEKGFP